MKAEENLSLLPYNTFGMQVRGREVYTINDTDDLNYFPKDFTPKILGGGSNVLLTHDVMQVPLFINRTKGIEVIKEDEELVYVQVKSGEVWHEFVLYALAQKWYGIENLSLIPGTVGAAPMQNIGAYGVEVKDVIESVRYWEFATQTFKTLSNDACRFGYRDSIFKQELKEGIFITDVVFRLQKQAQLHTTYGAIQQQLKDSGITHPTPEDVSQAVIAIRSSKLPDPKVTGNAGSFFKNPTIPQVQYESLLATFTNMPSYKVSDSEVKIPAGWMIEHCGWKGYRDGDAGVHPLQALVIVNYGHAQGKEIYNLSERVLQSVREKFGITLEREVQIW